MLKSSLYPWRLALLIICGGAHFGSLLAGESKPLALPQLEERVQHDLQCLNLPPAWVKAETIEHEMLDVAVIGGGMAGMTAAFALIKEGVRHIHIFDENKPGQEGPWNKYARMRHLRSSKALAGPALGIPSLTFRAWYEACYGTAAWDELKYIPTFCWHDYLSWYRQVLDLPVSNQMVLQAIKPLLVGFELTFLCQQEVKVLYARKIVLATGREGFGGQEIPEFMQELPKRFYVHTGENIDAAIFAGKRVVVVGAGASAFDTAAVALENGAEDVVMLVRRKVLPLVNKFSKFSFPGILHGFYSLSDETRCYLFVEAFQSGIPPTQEAVERVKGNMSLRICYDVTIQRVEQNLQGVLIHTAKGDFAGDLVVLGTGYGVDGFKRPEMQSFMDVVLLWQGHVSEEILERVPKLGHFPYLGAHFQFQEKEAGLAPYLKHIYCFNYGAFLSHGLISGDIPGISIGAARLAAGVAADFLLEDIELYKKSVKGYAMPLFDVADYPFLVK